MTETTQPPRLDFHDQRIDMAHWWPRVQDLDVPTPETRALPLERQEGEPPTWDTDRAVEIVEDLGGEAFSRSGYKSAQIQLSEGSHVRRPDPEHVDGTLTELVAQHAMMQMPVGESLWLRELLDVDFCAYCRPNLAPELRVFVRDGEIVCHHPRLEGFDRAPDHHCEQAVEVVESGWDAEFRDETVREYAERVADEFDDAWWSVDFLCDVDGQWWLTDMALDGIYERDGELRNVSDHPENCDRDCEAILEADQND